MKKLLVLAMTLSMLVVSVFSVAAEEVETEVFESNMDAQTYLETRLASVMEALENQEITQEEADLLIAHIEEVASEGSFGNGPEEGFKGEGNAECILGENSLGIFRSESAGNRTGQGNGVGDTLRDGSGSGSGNGSSKGNGSRSGEQASGNGNRRGNADGSGMNQSEDCVYE